MSNLLTIQGLTKKYGSNTALNNINLSIAPGHITGLLGPNGSGKTTLIKTICGLLVPNSGTISVDGNPVGIESKKIISYLPDCTCLDDSMTITAIVKTFKYFFEDFDTERAYEMLSNLSIDTKARFKTLSKGTKEKVQLILAMSRRAKLYLLDEPIGGVDPAAREYILNTIMNNYDSSASIIISTHLISDVEQLMDDAIFLQNGQVKLHKPVDDIRAEYGKSLDEYFREVYRC